MIRFATARSWHSSDAAAAARARGFYGEQAARIGLAQLAAEADRG